VIQLILNLGPIFKHKVLNLDITGSEIQGDIDYIKSAKDICSEFNDISLDQSLPEIFKEIEEYTEQYLKNVVRYESRIYEQMTLPDVITSFFNDDIDKYLKYMIGCDNPKPLNELVQGEDYIPLTTCNEKKRIYTESVDYNQRVGDEKKIVNEELFVCPATYYKSLAYLLDGKELETYFLPEIVDKDDLALDEITFRHTKINPESLAGGHVELDYYKSKYLKYKQKYLQLKSRKEKN
jgi:hypothetical protein